MTTREIKIEITTQTGHVVTVAVDVTDRNATLYVTDENSRYSRNLVENAANITVTDNHASH